MDEMLRLEYACTPDEVKEAEELVVCSSVGGGSKWLTVCILLVVFGVTLLSFCRRVEPPHRPYMFAVVVIITVIIIAVQHSRERRRKMASESTGLVEITAREIRVAGESGWAISPMPSVRDGAKL